MSNEGRATQKEIISPVRMGFVVERTERDEIQRLAKQKNLTISSFLAQVIREALDLDAEKPIKYF